MNSVSPIIENADIDMSLCDIAASTPHSGLFLFTDSNVRRDVFPLLSNFIDRYSPRIMEMKPGEDNKNLETLAEVWRFLSGNGATRDSLLINIGGGVVTDLGGFAAATFKRGIRFINLPTTLLAAADAASGGKTGIDFDGLKNEIGAFSSPLATLISMRPFATLPRREMISGLGEIVKMSIIADKEQYFRICNSDILGDSDMLRTSLMMAIAEKKKITDADPFEKGLRKILNFGHTAGHAFESFLMERKRPVSHGAAVAHGIMVALILSNLRLGMPSSRIQEYLGNILRPYFPAISFGCNDYPRIAEYMSHDKKNRSSESFRFVLLSDIASPEPDVEISREDFFSALDIYRDLTGI